MKKTTIILILLLTCLSCSQIKYTPPELSSTYDLQFSELATMKSGRYGMGYTTDGKYLYAVYGKSRDPHYVTKSEKYDIANDKWSVFQNNKITKRFISAEYVGDKIYVFNGYSHDNSINKKVEVINPLTGEIVYLKDNLAPVCYSGTAVWKDKIYVFGGSVYDNRPGMTTYSNQMYLFNPINDEWTLLGVIPEHKQTRGEIVDGILYVFGGYNGQISSKIDAYDIANNTWYYIGDMPVGVSANAITKHGNFIWLVGDYNDRNLLGVFNTKTLEYFLIKSNMLGRRHAGAEIVGNKLYVYGGNREAKVSTGKILASIQVADITEIEKLLSQEISNGN